MKKPDSEERDSLPTAENADADPGTSVNDKWDISRLSAGEISALRKSAGIMMNVSPVRSQAAFFKAVCRCKSWQEPYWFASVCMQSLWNKSDVRKRLFPEILRDMYQDKNATDSTREKCVSFLDYSWENDGFLLSKICGLAKRMKADNPNVMPDFEKLADDLSHWNNPEHYVQQRWLRIICLNGKNHQEEEGEENAD